VHTSKSKKLSTKIEKGEEEAIEEIKHVSVGVIQISMLCSFRTTYCPLFRISTEEAYRFLHYKVDSLCKICLGQWAYNHSLDLKSEPAPF